MLATLEALDLGDRRFGRVFAVRVAHVCREPELAARRLAPGGRLVSVYG